MKSGRTKLVFGKFFWSDWRSDPALRLCSYAARGLWMDLLCIAADHDPVGYVAVAGKPLDFAAIARMTGGNLEEVTALIEELEGNSVFSRDRRGWIFSRRLIREAKMRDKAKIDGKKGGNPTLCNKEKKTEGVKGGDNLNANPQSLEARTDTNVSGADAPGADKRKQVFDLGKRILSADGTSPSAAGGIITNLLANYPIERVLSVLTDPSTATASHKVSWIKKALQNDQSIRDDGLDFVRREAERIRAADERQRQQQSPEETANALPEKKRAIGEEA